MASIPPGVRFDPTCHQNRTAVSSTSFGQHGRFFADMSRLTFASCIHNKQAFTRQLLPRFSEVPRCRVIERDQQLIFRQKIETVVEHRNAVRKVLEKNYHRAEFVLFVKVFKFKASLHCSAIVFKYDGYTEITYVKDSSKLQFFFRYTAPQQLRQQTILTTHIHFTLILAPVIYTVFESALHSRTTECRTLRVVSCVYFPCHARDRTISPVRKDDDEKKHFTVMSKRVDGSSTKPNRHTESRVCKDRRSYVNKRLKRIQTQNWENIFVGFIAIVCVFLYHPAIRVCVCGIIIPMLIATITINNCHFTPSSMAKENTPATPLVRVHSSGVVGRRRSLQPLRTSSCRSDRPHNLVSVEDIRCHFPIRVLSGKYVTPCETNKTLDDNENTIVSPLRSGCKRPGSYVTDEEEVTQSKQICYSHQCSDTNYSEHKLTMGAYVKAHPRYFRRRNSADCMRQPNPDRGKVCDANVTTYISRLSPICPVPMPEGFPLQLPPCATVSLPWEGRRAMLTPRQPQRTAETQTSPTESTTTVSDQKGSRSKRQSFGSSQMFVGLRKTFGSLRRAISAERLHRSSNSLLESTKRNSSQKPTPPKNQSNHQKSITTASFTKEVNASKLTCQVVSKLPDGSIRIALRRGSTRQQFGFFIARDSEGIYISRLGGVRSAVKFWDLFRVGDRILEVQGTSCSKLDVEDVQNLTRGCELVEFRIKPTHASNVTYSFTQSSC
ncbi:hypothetical protein CLF_108091 [Clonorchis sinensis]|uniref:PDZ domain-containing protein n=1 Tax=Clonorchis sinensis TaxID=79923 RepID=H2KU85_CLOSI|nr:hypothetical protein CLF_108091 [Clonorchis sinensis]